jgi:hypothetical protein
MQEILPGIFQNSQKSIIGANPKISIRKDFREIRIGNKIGIGETFNFVVQEKPDRCFTF